MKLESYSVAILSKIKTFVSYSFNPSRSYSVAILSKIKTNLNNNKNKN